MRKGDQTRCGHDGCTMLLRWSGAAWVHTIRGGYGHDPVPPEALTLPAPMPAREAVARMDRLTVVR